MLLRLFTLLVLTALAVPGANAMPSPDASATVLVVNADSWASTRIANEYVALRSIPPANVVYLSGITSFDGLPVQAFRDQILEPLFKALDERGLTDKVRIITYSADFPTVIDVTGDLAGKQVARILAPQASINGLTYFATAVRAKETTYLDLHCNPYAQKFLGQRRDKPWTPEEQHKLAQALALLRKPSPGDPSAGQFMENVVKVIAALTEIRKAHRGSAILLYNLACCQALLGNADDAVALLREAVERGWYDVATTRADEDFKLIRDTPPFKALLAGMASITPEVKPHTAFTGSYGDRRYWLSTMLACTSGRGNSVDEALAYLRRSAAADGSHPDGTFYFMKNGDIRSTTREWAFADAAKRLNAFGRKAVVQDGILPQKQPPAAGVMVGIAGFSWKECGTEILPGAICEHLTSCGGMMGEHDGQTPLAEFLRYGAAGAAGTVTEPYALQGKFPNAYIHLFYTQGATLAEAFYESVTGPYQLLIVGDPLCRPWGKASKAAKPADTPVVTIDWDHALSLPAGPLETDVAFTDLEQNGRTQTPDGRTWTKMGPGNMSVVGACLGQGPVTVVPVGKDAKGREVRGTPVQAMVVPPPALAPVKPPQGQRLADGLLLRVLGQPQKVLAKLDDTHFAELSATEERSFELEAWFSVDADGVYQFQLGGTARCYIDVVDSQSFQRELWRSAGTWRYIPVPLQKGLHRVRFGGTARKGSTLDLRFGGTGTQRLTAPRFKHIPPPPDAVRWFPPGADARHSFLRAGDEIVCVGDSITAGGVYEEFLQSTLDALYADAKIRVVNQGVGGLSADGGVGLLKNYLKDHQPTVVLFMFGVNDTGWSDANADAKIKAFVTALGKAAECAKEKSLPFILLRETHFSHGKDPAPDAFETKVNGMLAKLFAAQDEFAKANGIPIIDVNGAYKDALAEAWGTDPAYEFTPDIVHPNSPGHAAMAVEILRAFGVGLPLSPATGVRGLLRIAPDSELSLGAHIVRFEDVTDGVEEHARLVPADEKVKLQLVPSVPAVAGADGKGTLQVVVAGHRREFLTKGFSSRFSDVMSGSPEFAVADLPGRWGAVPAYTAYVSGPSFAASGDLLWYSRVFAAETAPVTFAAADFLQLLDGPARTCPVSKVSVQRKGDEFTIDFTWADATPVPGKPGWKDRFGKVIDAPLNLNHREGQPCDAVEFFFDLRPAESIGRPTANTDANPAGVLRLGVYTESIDGKPVAKLQLPAELPATAATLAVTGTDAYRLTVRAKSAGPVAGFSMRVTDNSEFKNAETQPFCLTGRRGTGQEPMSYVLLGTTEAGVFCRIGY